MERPGETYHHAAFCHGATGRTLPSCSRLPWSHGENPVVIQPIAMRRLGEPYHHEAVWATERTPSMYEEVPRCDEPHRNGVNTEVNAKIAFRYSSRGILSKIGPGGRYSMWGFFFFG
jgi:hypothetical protein